ncbi:MAG: D-glycero-beta-D-manno-heptose-7-phosphate kinase [Elusimicrobiales bacterium]|nr:D-glycero-beta-D-manno-heptose-7-phosphate kinase [Elusimicrobiales bacterium]
MTRSDKARLIKTVRSFTGRKIAVFGDVMLDRFVQGTVGRISPEAPVPVVHVKKETSIPGGAGNVASNLAALGAKPVLISVAGSDSARGELCNSLSERGVDVSFILPDERRPTTEKVRVIAEHQQVVRFDRESLAPLGRNTVKRCLDAFSEASRGAGGAILSDYGKGMLTASSIPSLVAQCRKRRLPVCVDPKVEHFRRYRGVTCITPNTKEAWEGMRAHPRDGQRPIEDLGRKILRALNSETVLITQGASGMTLLRRSALNSPFHIPTVAREVFDVTGAGDTVISVFTLALACGAAFEEAAVIANHAAGIVVGKLGTATASQDEIIKALEEHGN